VASNLLTGGLAATINKAFKNVFMDATLARDTRSGGTSYEPGPVTTATYSCKAIEDSYGAMFMANGLVDTNNVKILVLAGSLAVEPQPLDRITIRGKTYTVSTASAGVPPVQSDPARATWELRCV